MQRRTHLYRKAAALLGLTLAIRVLSFQPAAMADPVIPSVWDIVADDFESGTLDAWLVSSAASPSLVSSGGHDGSTGLSVSMSQNASYVYQTDVARAEEGYLTFWFDPNSAVIPDPFTWWPPDNSISLPTTAP